MIENIRNALSSLVVNKMRAALTMLGIAIGIAAVIVLVSIGQGVQSYIENAFLGMGANLLFVLPDSFSNLGALGSNTMRSGTISAGGSTLTMGDADALAEPINVPDASAVVPLLSVRRITKYENNEISKSITGTSTDWLDALGRGIAFGRFFDETDMISNARVAVIGQTTVERLFPPGRFPVGERIRIGDVNFEVIGVLTEKGGGTFGDADHMIVVPLSTAFSRLTSDRSLSGDRTLTMIYVQSASDDLIDEVRIQTADVLRDRHDIGFQGEDDFIILSQSEILDAFGSITGLLTVFLGIIAGISLLVGGIGIMNIMLVSVTERTREIGLRKAVGAHPRDILSQFLVEAVVLSIVGGTAGLIVAALGTFLVTVIVPDLPVTIQLDSVMLSAGVSIGIGMFFGIVPARRAAALNPIDALRYE